LLVGGTVGGTVGIGVGGSECVIVVRVRHIVAVLLLVYLVLGWWCYWTDEQT
jgi:hypothetical protein